MKHFLLLLLLSGSGTAVSAQLFSGQSADQRAYVLSTGYFGGDFTALNDHFLQPGTSPGFNPYFMTLGLSWVAPTAGRYGEHKGMLDAGMILPQQLKAGDSLALRMQGWYILSSLWGYDLLRENAALALELAPGVHWGGLYLRETSTGERWKNPFIAPMARAEFRVVLQPIAFGVRAMYRYDITSPKWKEGSGDPGKSRISGPGVQVFVGWGKAG